MLRISSEEKRIVRTAHGVKLNTATTYRLTTLKASFFATFCFAPWRSLLASPI